MPLAVRQPGPQSRVVGRGTVSRVVMPPVLRVPPPRPLLMVPVVVAREPRPARERRLTPRDEAPAPVLRLPGERPPVVVRFSLVPPPIVEPAAAPGPMAVASEVGIIGTTGTQVWMEPADLTQTGRVDITRFHVAIQAGVW